MKLDTCQPVTMSQAFEDHVGVDDCPNPRHHGASIAPHSVVAASTSLSPSYNLANFYLDQGRRKPTKLG